MIEHQSEFYTAQKKALSQEDRELAAAYTRLFSSDDGKRVLDSLILKFDPLRARFYGHSDIVQAAKIDGQCDVIREIRRGIDIGSPVTGIAIPQ